MSTAASSTSYQGASAGRLAGAVPPLLFGLRIATAVSLALFTAFYLQLETPSWAGTSACVVCQPILGSSLLKGVARMAGTVIGALASLVLTAIFPQDRAAFLFAMLLWLSICGFVASLLRNFAAYAALLAGFTLAIIAGTSIPAPDQVFDIAVGRASEICVGIVCGTLVMALTDLGNSPRQLAVLFSQLITDTAAHLAGILAQAGSPHADLSDQRRALIARTTALDPVIGAAAGESPELLQRRATLRAAMNGLFRASAGARILETHLRSLPSAEAEHIAGIVQDQLPPDWAPVQHGLAQTALDRAGDVSVVRRLLALGTNDDPSMRLTADAAANVAIGLAIAANGLTLLEDPAAARDVKRPFSLFVADWLPALISALRIFLGVGAAVMFWIVTAWPNGLLAITFAAITIMAFAPVPGSKMTALGQGLGSLLTAIAVAIIKFALLPNHESFLAFSLIVAVALVPLGALSTVPVLAPYLLPAMVNFIPLLTPTNQISYDLQGYFNTASSLLIGCIFGIVTLVLFPPISSSIRSQRLVDLSIRDFRRIATGRRRWTRSQWQNRIYARLAAMPEDCEPVQRSYLVSALSLGTEIIRLQLRSRHCGIEIELPAALARLGAGDLSELRRALGTIDLAISSIPPDRSGALARLRARSTLLSIREAVDRHHEYFESRPS